MLFATTAVSAQDYQKNIYGVKVGLNISNISMKLGSWAMSPAARPGIAVSGTYQRLLTQNLPLYLETGLDFSMEGSKYKYDEYESDTYNLWYMKIPVMINYKFYVKDFTFYPSVGIYYALGLGGNVKYKYTGDGETETYKDKAFGKYDENTGEGGMLKRSDFGIRVGVTGQWKRFSLGLSYSKGFLNIADTSEDGNYDSGTVFRNWCFNISVGYNF